MKFNKKYLVAAVFVGSLATSGLAADSASAMRAVVVAGSTNNNNLSMHNNLGSGQEQDGVSTDARVQGVKSIDDGIGLSATTNSPAGGGGATSTVASTPMWPGCDDSSASASPDPRFANSTSTHTPPMGNGRPSPWTDQGWGRSGDRNASDTPLTFGEEQNEDVDARELEAPDEQVSANDDIARRALGLLPEVIADSWPNRQDVVVQALNLDDGGVRLGYADGRRVIDPDPIPYVPDTDDSNASSSTYPNRSADGERTRSHTPIGGENGDFGVHNAAALHRGDSERADDDSSADNASNATPDREFEVSAQGL